MIILNLINYFFFLAPAAAAWPGLGRLVPYLERR
jgi:hypothetical protein